MPTLDPTSTVNVDTALTGTTTGLNNLNLLQPTAFKLIVDRKNFANLEFFCQNVSHPNISVPVAEVPYSRIGNLAIPGDKLTFGELEAIIVVDENMNSYTEMYNCLHRMVQKPERSRLNRSMTDTAPPTTTDITLAMLSSHNNVTRTIRYIDCVPTSLGQMDMSAVAGDTIAITFPVTFRFSYFELD